MELNLYIVPKDPYFALPDVQFEALRQRVEELIDSFDDLYYNLRYVNQYQNRHAVGWLESIDGIQCPRCKALLNLGVDEWDDWFSGFNDVLYGTNPLDSRVVMPCCGAMVAIGNIRFPFSDTL